MKESKAFFMFRAFLILLGVIIGILVLPVFFSSCQTRVIKETTTVLDSTWVKKYDSLVKVPLKGPQIILKDNPCADLCDSLGRVKDYTKSVTSETGIKGTIKADKKTQSIIIDCGKADSFEFLLKDARTEIKHLRQEKKVVEVSADCNKEHRTGFDSFCRWMFWIFCIAFTISLGLLYLKSKFGGKL